MAVWRKGSKWQLFAPTQLSGSSASPSCVPDLPSLSSPSIIEPTQLAMGKNTHLALTKASDCKLGARAQSMPRSAPSPDTHAECLIRGIVLDHTQMSYTARTQSCVIVRHAFMIPAVCSHRVRVWFLFCQYTPSTSSRYANEISSRRHTFPPRSFFSPHLFRSSTNFHLLAAMMLVYSSPCAFVEARTSECLACLIIRIATTASADDRWGLYSELHRLTACPLGLACHEGYLQTQLTTDCRASKRAQINPSVYLEPTAPHLLHDLGPHP